MCFFPWWLLKGKKFQFLLSFFLLEIKFWNEAWKILKNFCLLFVLWCLKIKVFKQKNCTKINKFESFFLLQNSTVLLLKCAKKKIKKWFVWTCNLRILYFQTHWWYKFVSFPENNLKIPLKSIFFHKSQPSFLLPANNIHNLSPTFSHNKRNYHINSSILSRGNKLSIIIAFLCHSHWPTSIRHSITTNYPINDKIMRHIDDISD